MIYTLEHILGNLPTRVRDRITAKAKEMAACEDMPLSKHMDDIIEQPYEASHASGEIYYPTYNFLHDLLTSEPLVPCVYEPCYEPTGPSGMLSTGTFHNYVEMSEFLLMEQLTSNEEGLGTDRVDAMGEIVPLSQELMARAMELVKDVVVSDDDFIADDISFESSATSIRATAKVVRSTLPLPFSLDDEDDDIPPAFPWDKAKAMRFRDEHPQD